jgi:hypothetical protein
VGSQAAKVRGLPDLKDIWVMRDGKMVAEGDAATIDVLLGDLDRVADGAAGWTILYRDRETEAFWELSYPQSEMHGGGPRRLRQLDIPAAEAWIPYQD